MTSTGNVIDYLKCSKKCLEVRKFESVPKNAVAERNDKCCINLGQSPVQCFFECIKKKKERKQLTNLPLPK